MSLLRRAVLWLFQALDYLPDQEPTDVHRSRPRLAGVVQNEAQEMLDQLIVDGVILVDPGLCDAALLYVEQQDDGVKIQVAYSGDLNALYHHLQGLTTMTQHDSTHARMH